jgi:hypothetical protein
MKVSPQKLLAICKPLGGSKQLIVFSEDKQVYKSDGYNFRDCGKDETAVNDKIQKAKAAGRLIEFELKYNFRPAEDFAISEKMDPLAPASSTAAVATSKK